MSKNIFIQILMSIKIYKYYAQYFTILKPDRHNVPFVSFECYDMYVND